MDLFYDRACQSGQLLLLRCRNCHQDEVISVHIDKVFEQVILCCLWEHCYVASFHCLLQEFAVCCMIQCLFYVP